MRTKPGDRVVIDWISNGDIHGIECEVVKGTKGTVVGTEDRIWLKHPGCSELFWLLPHHIKLISQEIQSITKVCLDCKGTGRIKLFTSIVDCDCVKKPFLTETHERIRKAIYGDCEFCSYEYCECPGDCCEDDGGSCGRCDVWTCGGCLMDGVCGSCYSKIQGGVI